ncbi:MAG: TrkH family potassium uptake protein [Tissierellia bacterium]|nr:TrkH family potassium uptake protein [Tissierellia bacterium]
MNTSLIKNTIGKILILEAGFLLLPLAVAIYYRESFNNLFSFLITIAILLVLGIYLSKTDIENMKFGIKDGFGVVTLSWLSLSFFGSLPFLISGEIKSFVDAIFETASGFTTTGASILVDVEAMSQSMLFWRSFTHFIGGMGILVFALAVLPKTAKGSVNIMKAEVPGPTFGKLVSKIDITAKILYKIYVSMTVVLILILILIGMKPFDAMIHAFGAAGTGGFSNKALSVGYFDSAAVDYVLGIAMLLYGINFNLYYLILIGRAKDIFRSEELKVYFTIVLFATALICIDISHLYHSFANLVRDVFFTVASIITTTGYATADFARWPLFSHFVLLMLMFFGACAGSTAGGLKISRVIILFKSGINAIKEAINPRRVVSISHEEAPVPREIVKSAHMYFILYVGIFISILFIISIRIDDFTTAFSAVAATLNNIGPGLAAVGPTGNYAGFSPYAKVVLTFAMITGRLEIFPVIALFAPNTWRKR